MAAHLSMGVPGSLDERHAGLPRHEVIESTRGRSMLISHSRSSPARPAADYFVRSTVSAAGAFFFTAAIPASIALGDSYISLLPTT